MLGESVQKVFQTAAAPFRAFLDSWWPAPQAAHRLSQYVIMAESAEATTEAVLMTHAEIGRGSYGCVYAADLQLLSEPGKRELALKSFRCKARSSGGKGSSSSASDEEQEEMDFVGIATELLGTDGSAAAACPYLAPRLGVLRTAGGHWLQWHVLMERACTDMQCAALTVPMSLKLVRWFGGQIARALVFLHGRGIVHRDIKPSNVLLASSSSSSSELPHVWLTDWGMALMRPSSADHFVTTAWYRAPEIVLGLEHTAAADVWSFGVLLRRLAVGREFMSALDEAPVVLDQLFQRICVPTPEEWPDMYDPALRYKDTVHALQLREQGCAAFQSSVTNAFAGTLDLLHGTKSMSSNPYAGGNRPLGLASAKWTARLYGTCASGRPAFSPQLSAVLQACLQPNPAHRPTMADVLRMPFFAEAATLSASDTAFLAQRLVMAREERQLRALSPTLSRSYVVGTGRDLAAPPTLRGAVPLCLAVGAAAKAESSRARVAPQAALHALYGGEAESFRTRATWIAQLCRARHRLHLPPACVLYAVDFMDRVAHDIAPSALLPTTCAALFVAQIVCCDYGKLARMRTLMDSLGAPPDLHLSDVRELCCRMLASLDYTVHGGNAEAPQLWSSWSALRILRGAEPSPRQVSMALIVLCLWPLHGADAGIDRAQAMTACLELDCASTAGEASRASEASKASEASRTTHGAWRAGVEHLKELVAALDNAEQFRGTLEALLLPAAATDAAPTASTSASLADTPCSSISVHSSVAARMEE